LKSHSQADKYEYNRSGSYQMKCIDCSLKYISQTGMTFNISYKSTYTSHRK
jgi:hypothetical protein